MGDELTSDRDTGEAEPLLDIKYILDMVGRRQDDRLGDEAVLVALGCTDHGGLGSRRLVVMNDTDTALEL